MQDLLGYPIEPNPPMNAPLPWRIFRMNDCDWWVARTLDEAKADYQATCGDDVEFENEGELSDADMDSTMFCDADNHRQKHSYRTELDHMVKRGIAGPHCFASTEY